MAASHRLKTAEWLALLAVLALAGWLRLGWAGVNSFSFDEARVSHMALQMARQGKFALLGMQSSTGVPNFPAAVWLFALPYWLSANPMVATWFAGVANLLGVLGIWWLARQAWGFSAGLSAALLLAASPFGVYYSRSVWAQNWLVPLSILWAVAAVHGLVRRADWAIAVHVFLAGFVGQVHLAGVVLILGSAWLLVRFRLWKRWRAVSAGALAALLAAAPTVYTIIRYGEGAKAELMQLWQQSPAFRWEGFRQLWALGLGLDGFRNWLGSRWQWSGPMAAGLRLGAAVLAAGIGVGLIGVIVRVVAGARSRDSAVPDGEEVLSALLPVWALAGPLFFLWSRTPVHGQYQLPSLPALFLLVGSVAGLVRRRWWNGSVILLLLLVAAVQSAAIGQALNLVERELAPGGMGTPLRYPQAAVTTLEADSRPVAVHTAGDMVEFDGDAAVFEVLLWVYPHQIVDARSTLLVPDRPAHLLFTFADLPAWQVARDLGLEGTVRELPRRQGEPPFVALTLDDVDLNLSPTGPFRLANGAELQGWKLEQDGTTGRLRLLTHWQVVGPIAEGHYQQFNHLYLPGQAAPTAIHDVTTSSRAWNPGDHLVIWADFDAPGVPPDHLDVGMYSWPDLQRVPVVNRDGDSLAPIRLDLAQAP